jgi:hypothetical protein
MKFDPPTGVKGRRRQLEIANENAAAIQTWVTSLIAGLGREATAAEQLIAEAVASLFVRQPVCAPMAETTPRSCARPPRWCGIRCSATRAPRRGLPNRA